MVKTGYCAVAGCKDRESSRHSFPNPNINKDLFEKWLKACRNEKLLLMTQEQVYKTHKVCYLHFRLEDRATNMYLKKGAYPMLNLPSAAVALVRDEELQEPTMEELEQQNTVSILSESPEQMPPTSSITDTSGKRRRKLLSTPVHFVHGEDATRSQNTPKNVKCGM